eukprot:TRINITY_DN10498_c0_g1_i1.p1 TRINITY_DN10498_c0_g1~~TRINITY_DN10498_c0_g1_i1.p1  ORF type:complete len:654 (-),score=143.75 TRINITY_DN10498_c0_g1_i1:99-2060(-)
MLLTLLQLLSGPFAWSIFLTRLFPRLTVLERLGASIVSGFTTTSWLCLFVSTYQGVLDANALVTVSGINLAFAWVQHRSLMASQTTKHGTPHGFLSLLAADFRSIDTHRISLLICSIAPLVVSYIMSTHLIPVGSGGKWLTGGNCYADLPFHLSVLTSFVYGKNSRNFSVFKMMEIIFDGSRLIYPIIPDYFSATLVVTGLSLRDALLYPSIMMAWTFFLILYAVSFRFTRSQVAAVVTVFLTLCCGGGYDFKEPEFWLYFIKDIFLPQRSAMFAYSQALLSFAALWIAQAERVNRATRWQYFQLSGLFAALLPYLQGHSYICVIIVVFVTIMTDMVIWIDNPLKTVVDCSAWGMPAFVFGFPQMYSFMNTASRWGFAQFMPMWTKYPSGMLAWYWDCLGVFLFLSMFGTYYLPSPSKRKMVGFWFLFVIASFFKFQPWNVDNMKLFYVAYFPMAMAVGHLYDFLQKKSIIARILGFFVLISLMIPGIQCLIQKEIMHQSVILNHADVKLGEWARDNTGPEAVFLIHPRHNHPIPMIAGRAVYYGYKGWLQTRGYKWGMKESFVRKILKGDKDALDICRDRGIDYIALPKSQKNIENVDVNYTFLRKEMEKVYDNEQYVVFEVKKKGKMPFRHMFADIYHFGHTSRGADNNRH